MHIYPDPVSLCHAFWPAVPLPLSTGPAGVVEAQRSDGRRWRGYQVHDGNCCAQGTVRVGWAGRGDGSSEVGLGFIHVLHPSVATVDQLQNKIHLCYLVLLLTSIRLRALGLILAVCLLVRIGMLKIVRSQKLEVSPCCLYTMGGTYGGVRNHGFA